MKLFANDAVLRATENKRLRLHKAPLFAALCTVVLAGLTVASSVAAENDGIAVAIVYDTSGSMKEAVKDGQGHSSPKYIIANRALMAIADQISAFAAKSPTGTPRKVEAGVFTFDGNTAREAVKFGPFNADAIKGWAKTFNHPAGNTPLGNSLEVASHALMNSPLSRKHLLVITDGINTVGPTPAAVLPRIKKEIEQKGGSLAAHFVAFDVAAKVFDPVKREGATVVAAADEKQLNTQLDFILQRKILLEDEEPGKKP